MGRRRKTHEEYVNEVKKINQNIEVVGKYINTETKIVHKCKIDGYEWSVKPSHILNGSGCPLCANKKRKKTNDQYIKEVENINPNIEVIEKYIDNKTNIIHRCKIDGHEWSAKPNNILNGNGCPVCYGNTKKTHEQYVAEVAEVNPNIKVVGKYINNATKILHRCENGHEWETIPTVILSGHGCPKCVGIGTKKTHEEYVERLKYIHPNIEVLDTYVDSKTKILHKCNTCGYEWMVVPDSILHCCGCPCCSGKIKTHDKYVKELSKVNPYIDIIGEYVDSKTKILHKCNICGYEWCVTPHNVLHDRGCPKCSISHGERSVETYLIEHGINYIWQHKFDDCRNKYPLPFDFYLPDYNSCIEYDGRQHYEPIDCFGGEENLQYTIQNDNIKTKYCEDNNITLLRIRYDDDVNKILDTFFG